MGTLRNIALITAICITIVYEVILFTTLMRGAYDSQTVSVFMTFLFSLAGATPIVIILIIFFKPPIVKKYGGVEDSDTL